MIILDTNVVSELMRPTPSQSVVAWLDKQAVLELFITSVTVAEIYYGLEALPNGKRRQALETAFARMLHQAFNDRVLSFDEKAAFHYGQLMGKRKSTGKPMSILDGQIAAIAVSHHATIATRNISDFKYCDLSLVNPWKQEV